jgi:hypothetical protein
MSKRSGLSNELRPSPFDFLNRHWESDCECSSAHDHFKHEEPKPTSLHMAMLSGICSDSSTKSGIIGEAAGPFVVAKTRERGARINDCCPGGF